VKTTRLRVVLCDVDPALARVIDVPAAVTLPELHDLLQAAIGWTNSHLHQFVTPEATYGVDLDTDDDIIRCNMMSCAHKSHSTMRSSSSWIAQRGQLVRPGQN
jgi:Plasmid pRiA4b ORF-3-like protein